MHSLIEPAAIAPPASGKSRCKFASCDQARFETPWQDRQTLLLSRDNTRQPLAVLLMAFGTWPENHERKNNVRHTSR
jgi:hypothetical protein